jgi:hypothetical protein
MEEEIKQEEVQEEKKEEKREKEKPLDKMTATELREIALEIPDIDGAHAMKKEDLLKAIKKARGIEDEEPVKRKKKAVKQGVDVRALKEKITQLKTEKESLRGEKDRKKVDVLRRRINRLKKRTRKAAAPA